MEYFDKIFIANLGDPASIITLFNQLPDIHFFMKDRQSRYTGFNRNFAQRLGYKNVTDLLGKTTEETCPPELASAYIKDDLDVMQSNRPSYDILELNQSYDGTMNWFVTTKIPLHDQNGQVIGLAGIARDIKRAKAALEHFQRFEKVFMYIENHVSERIEIPELAALMHVSVSKFERDFKKFFRTTPSQYIIQFRIKSACRLLAESTRSIAEISGECGFYDQSSMTRSFRSHLNISPSAYRKTHRRGSGMSN
ncbi:AraC family transcriptional regulator [Pontiella agarivorans]|uniref:AraC family transcriptional regulator n=1 Tax=Pontiella agarivorans TaxID=3038953 RepID=A0ABU5MW41_9BACT|nr:AraC family transcriptional regulator [Pontiella agarivorans]MDZ8118446.1 AraC family transcriptional regulator [Pontiella agarivorans]